jgi:RNA polymerase sigma-70 factor (ECF subfamily)
MTSHRHLGGDWDWAEAHDRCLSLARRTLPLDDALDVTQEALLRAWRKLDQCHDESASLAWILQITRNEVLRSLERRREHASLDAVAEPTCEAGTDAIDVRISVRAALENLPAEDQTLLSLRYEADLTQSAVAKRTGMPEGTVKVRLYRSRNQLRQALKEMT